MTVSHAAEDAVLGGERRTDGLWIHKGKLSVGATTPGVPGLSGDINANRGGGTGAYYFGGQGDKYLFFNGTDFVFSPPLGPVALAAGAAQQQIAAYRSGVSVNTTAVSTWVITSISTGPVACSGFLTRFEVTTMAWHSVATGVLLIGLAADGAVYMDSCAMIQQQVANQPTPVTFIAYGTPSAATHTFGLALYSTVAGTANLGHTFMNTTIYVTEQRR